VLSVEALEVRYGGYLALSDVWLEVGRGEVACLLGANGSGKSSLLNAVSGLVPPAAGRVVFDGAPIISRARLDAGEPALRMMKPWPSRRTARDRPDRLPCGRPRHY